MNSYVDMQELYKQRADLTLQIAIRELAEAEADELIADVEGDEQLALEAAEYFESTKARIFRLIDKTVTRKKRKAAMMRALPKAMKAVACVLLVCFIGATVALATVRSVRVRFTQFLINIEREYTELSMEQSEVEIEIPSNWQGSYYPTWIPEGFSVESVITASIPAVRFIDASERIISFTELDPDAVTNINTEDAIIRYVTVNGHHVLLAERENYIVSTWSIEDKYFVLWMNGTAEELLPVIEGVRKVK